MAISRVEIKDFFVFKGEFAMDFCPGVNVFIGSNGTGKTTLLRATAIQPALGHPYSSSYGFHMYHGTANMRKISNKIEVFPFEDEKYDKNKHIFIPAAEMLSHPEIYPMSEKYNLPYNNSEIDILENAMQPETREITPNAAKVLGRISEVIGGEISYENNTFFVMSDKGKIPFSLEASGFQKFGLLWKLLRNGLIESESVLFWDEPENSLNPELVPVLVDILFELSRNGVQIFIATHSDFLCKWFELKTGDGHNEDIEFFSLYKENGTIRFKSSQSYTMLEHNSIIDQSVELYNEHLRRATEHDED
ncbi:MAG: AAA family ATPase [Clostridiales bacterium]|jgi:AAA15 family ATPase/GTPase|nr:AAA family ATPase [Clostridiales bacterium]